MPLYDFQCECGNQQELIVPIGESIICSKCGLKMKRKFSLPSIISKKSQRSNIVDELNLGENKYAGTIMQTLEKQKRQW